MFQLGSIIAFDAPPSSADPPSLAEILPLLLITAGLVVALLAIKWLLPKGRTPKAVRRSPDHGQDNSSRETSVRSVTRDAEELAQRLAAEMDARAQRLESLLAEARQIIQRLEELGPGASSAPSGAGERSQPADPDAIAARIFALADAGKTPIEIARALGQHTGQVELILALRR